MNTINPDKVLMAIANAVDLKIEPSCFWEEYLDTRLTRPNIKKVVKIGEAVKYAGLHLNVEYRENSRILRIWVESNTDTTYQDPMTLINIEHDLESLLD